MSTFGPLTHPSNIGTTNKPIKRTTRTSKDEKSTKERKGVSRKDSRSSASGSDGEFLTLCDQVEHMSDWGFNGTFCNHCGLKNSEISGMLMQCGKCKNAYFCSTKCFNEALPEHQKTCQTASWTRDPKGTKIGKAAPSFNDEMGTTKEYISPIPVDGEAISSKVPSPSRRTSKSTVPVKGKKTHVPNSRQPIDGSKIAKDRKKAAETSVDAHDDESDADDDDGKKKTKLQLSRPPPGKTKKGAKKVHDDGNNSDSSATVETDDDDEEKIVNSGDDVTAAVMLARKNMNVKNKGYGDDYDSDEDEDEDDDEDDDDSNGYEPDEGDKNGENGNYRDDDDDESDESEYEYVYDVTTQTTVAVKKATTVPKLTGTRSSKKQQPKEKNRFKFRGTPVDGIPEEEDDAIGSRHVTIEFGQKNHDDDDGHDGSLVDLQSDDDEEDENENDLIDEDGQRRRSHDRTRMRKNKNGNSTDSVDLKGTKQWPTGRRFPEPVPPEKEIVRLRSRDQRPGHTSHDDSFSAQVLLENDVHDEYPDEYENEEEGDEEVEEWDTRGRSRMRHSTSILLATDSSSNKARYRRRGRCHSMDDIDLLTRAAWRAGRGLKMPVEEPEKVQLRHIEIERFRVFGWEKPDWVTNRPIRERANSNDSNNGSFSVLNLCSVDEEGNHETDDGLRHVHGRSYNASGTFRLRPSTADYKSSGQKGHGSRKPEWVQRKKGLRSSGDFGRMYSSYSRINTQAGNMNSSASSILMTKEELRRVADLQRSANKSITWEQPEWVKKSPLKKTSKGKVLHSSGDLSRLSPKDLIESGKVAWKKPEWATRNPLQRTSDNFAKKNNSSNSMNNSGENVDDETSGERNNKKLCQIPNL